MIVYNEIISLSDKYSREYLEKGVFQITCFNEFDQVGGLVQCYSEGETRYFPFFWSPIECKILFDLNNNSYTSYTCPLSINSNGIIVGYTFKYYDKTFYLIPKKVEKKMLCKRIVPVIWFQPSQITEILLASDSNNYSNSFYNDFTTPCLTINDDGFVVFWLDTTKTECAGSIHITEFE